MQSKTLHRPALIVLANLHDTAYTHRGAVSTGVLMVTHETHAKAVCAAWLEELMTTLEVVVGLSLLSRGLRGRDVLLAKLELERERIEDARLRSEVPLRLRLSLRLRLRRRLRLGLRL